MKMRTHGVSVYPEVLQNADVVKVLLDVIVKELKKSANIDFEKDSYTEIPRFETWLQQSCTIT